MLIKQTRIPPILLFLKSNPCVLIRPLRLICAYAKDEISLWFLARDAIVRTNRRAIAVTFVRLSVRLGHVSADLSLWLDSRMFFNTALSLLTSPEAYF